MRFISGHLHNEVFIGLVDEQEKNVLHLQKAANLMGSHDVIPNTMLDIISSGDEVLNHIKEINKWADEQESKENFVYSINEIELMAPIPKPQKNIFCVGKNYAAHAIELGSEKDIPEHLMLFSKAPTTVIACGDTILKHEEVTSELDYEGELAVIIGKTGKAISKENAMDYVFGYTIINDVTARDLQERHKQFLLGKSLDTSCPMGPYLAHHSIIDNPGNLNIETRVNGEVRQASNTELFIFDIPTIIETISKGTTIEAGDIIATGTPSGVGKGFNPPKYLKPGDQIEITIDGLGTLRNKIEM